MVESVSGRSATFSFTRVPMAPAQQGSDATGTFNLTGRLTVDDLDDVFHEK